MLKLKNKAVNQYRADHTGKEFLALHQELMDTIDKDSNLRKLQSDLKGKKFSKDKTKRRKQVDVLYEEIKRRSPQIDYSIDGLIDFINKFDRLAKTPNKRYQGLEMLRDKDKKWNKLFRMAQDIKTEYNDTTLNHMIDGHVRWSYGCTGLLLLTDLIRWYIPPTYLQSEYLGSEAYYPAVILENFMTNLLTDINIRTKELSGKSYGSKQEPTIIKDTEVKIDADKVDKATGIEINKPTEMSNVHLDMKLHDVGEGTGIKSGLPLKVIMATCKKCGKPLPHVSFGVSVNSIKCNQCGEINELR